MRRKGVDLCRALSPAADSASVPTKKPSRHILFEEEELRRLFKLWKELRKPGRRGRPEYIGQKLTFNQWLGQQASAGAETTQRTLAATNAAATSGTVEESMPKTPSKPKSPKPSEPTKPRGRGRPPNPSDAPTWEPSNFKLPVGTKARIRRAVAAMALQSDQAPRDMTAFVIEAIDEKIARVMATAHRRPSK